ncbi:sulfotransferase domain-containing protein [Roseobacter weihaiensis]|uniref:sulfotransferase domain-containing protein n=1 Tax=Roseobacter weihaiensis TaxID=2763262 RepID=UPI001D0B1D6B|nr:sulfotransferase domain-containing protein [Roseobacter sp. H9]
MTLPDFMIVGAMKCGTSTLQAQLAAQDGVFMTTPKEPNFFSDDAVYARGIDWYRALYDGAAPGVLTGEASTHYTKRPTYPDTLARMQHAAQTAGAPLPRLLYMIRNPLDRAVSHYIHEWTEARMGQDPVAEFQRHPEIAAYSCYGMQIAPFIEAAGADQVFLTSLEQIKADPDAEFARIARFLGLGASAVWQHDMAAQNVSANRARRLPLQGLLLDNPVARTLRQTLVPKSLRTRIRARLTMQERPALPPTLIAGLQERFLEDRARLARQFPDHPALSLCFPFAGS